MVITPAGKKKKPKAAKGAVFKVKGKMYEADFVKVLDLKKVRPPKGGKKAIDAYFAKLAKDHGVKVYTEMNGKRVEVKTPTLEMYAIAGKKLVMTTVVMTQIKKGKVGVLTIKKK